MQFLCIAVNEYTDDIVPYLANELQQLKRNKLKYSIDAVNQGGATSVVCSINEEGFFGNRRSKLYNSMKTHICNALADYIISQYEEKLVLRIINSNYCYFTTVEKKQILKFAVKIIKNEDKSFINSLFQIRRKNIIVKKLLEYIDSESDLILDGFVNFRLKEYTKDLEDVVDKAVDEFLMEREYNEFIKLLRYFVDIQEPKFDEIHVLTGVNGRYILLDKSKNEITNECIQEFAAEISQGEINYDDLLVSSLITLAPSKIMLHSEESFTNRELLETIKNVFSGRVIICSDCEICSFTQFKNSNKK